MASSIASSAPANYDARPRLPSLSKPAAGATRFANWTYEQLTAPLPPRKQQAIEWFKTAVPWGCAAGAAIPALAMLTDAPNLGDALAAGAATAVLVPLEIAAMGWLARSRSADYAKAQHEALTLVADAMRDSNSSLITDVRVVEECGAPKYVQLTFDPAKLNALTADERAALPVTIGATLPVGVRKFLPYVAIELDRNREASTVSPPSRAFALEVAIDGFMGGLGFVIGSCAGGLAGTLVGAFAALGIGGFGAMGEPMFGEWMKVGVLLLGPLSGLALGLAMASGTASATAKAYRREVAAFRERACELLIAELEGRRSLLPPDIQECIGGFAVGKHDDGYPALAVSRRPGSTGAPDSSAIKDAFMRALPDQLARILESVPVRFDQPDATAEPKLGLMERLANATLALRAKLTRSSASSPGVDARDSN